MAYFIFLKYLRSLEEFRKNPHVKIPLKSPCANFQSLDIFKNQILFGKEFFHRFRPIRPFGPTVAHLFFFNRPLLLSPLGLSLSAGPTHPLGPANHALVAPCPLAASLTGKRLQSRRLCPLRARLIGGPHLSSLTSGSTRARPRRHRLPPLPAPPSSTPRDVVEPLLALLNLAPSSMALKSLTPLLPPPPRPPLPGAPPSPYKRVMRPLTLTAPYPLSSELLRALLRPRDELKPPSFAASGAPPLRHSSITGEHLPTIFLKTLEVTG
jgi:hypothetical protein